MADVTEKLEKLMHMLDRGLITREEFDAQKQQLMVGAGTIPPSSRPTSLGSYRLTGEIGVGGMGRVYRGRHRSESFASRQGGDVAIKLLHAQYSERPEIMERFEREAELGIKLDHPGIVRVFEMVVDAGQVALVMELVEGRPLSQMIGTETGPIPWARARPLFVQLLEAVGYAHEHGVIHRDLKPENIIIGPQGQLKVLDFGIAKDTSTGRTQTGTGMGTIDYMAPEQYLDAKSVDARADIYALGMTLYEMVAGQLPWPASTTEFTVLDRKRNGQLPPPTDFYPDISPAVVAYVQAMLKPDPTDRPASVDELVKQLEGLGSFSTRTTLPPAAPRARPVAAASVPQPAPSVPAPRPSETPPPSTAAPDEPSPVREVTFARVLSGTVLHGFIAFVLAIAWFIPLLPFDDDGINHGEIAGFTFGLTAFGLSAIAGGIFSTLHSWRYDPKRWVQLSPFRFLLVLTGMLWFGIALAGGHPSILGPFALLGIPASILIARKISKP
jgi:serine/threonine-protein kinase